jgi:hypothetical protein
MGFPVAAKHRPGPLWKPDLLTLGMETYNDHPSTEWISISEAYNTVKR